MTGKIWVLTLSLPSSAQLKRDSGGWDCGCVVGLWGPYLQAFCLRLPIFSPLFDATGSRNDEENVHSFLKLSFNVEFMCYSLTTRF